LVDSLFSLAYEELRRLASAVKQNDANCTLNPTALVHEAWLKLAGSPELAATSPLHFKRIAGRAMRQVLVEAARRRHSAKRGGGLVMVVDPDNLADPSSSHEQDMLTLEEALKELEQLAPRQAQVVESRFFGGLEFLEIASLLDLSEATVYREWRAAKAWLKVKLR
jgi:RNA polymerase sigma factor (TIGR02999 family)